MHKRIHTLRGLLCFVLCLTFAVCSSDARAQSTEILHTAVLEKAPHLPLMAAAEGKDVFYGEQYAYARKENEKRILEWVSRYPAEFKAYMTSIQKYLDQTREVELRAADKKRHADMKAQWVMIQQMNLAWPAETVNISTQN